MSEITIPFCSNCGAQVKEGHKFCNYCGIPLQSSASQQQHLAPPPPKQPTYQPQPTQQGERVIGILARAAGAPRQDLPEVNHTHLSSTYVSFLDKPEIQVDLVEYVMVMDEAPTSSRRCSEGFDGISSNPPHYASDMF